MIVCLYGRINKMLPASLAGKASPSATN